MMAATRQQFMVFRAPVGTRRDMLVGTAPLKAGRDSPKKGRNTAFLNVALRIDLKSSPCINYFWIVIPCLLPTRCPPHTERRKAELNWTALSTAAFPP